MGEIFCGKIGEEKKQQCAKGELSKRWRVFNSPSYWEERGVRKSFLKTDVKGKNGADWKLVGFSVS